MRIRTYTMLCVGMGLMLDYVNELSAVISVILYLISISQVLEKRAIRYRILKIYIIPSPFQSRLKLSKSVG
jgi:hypothetical protein